MFARRFIIGLAAGIAALAVGVPLAGAGNSATCPPPYRASDTIVDDYWRDGLQCVTATPSTSAPAVVISGGGFHWADFGIGIGVAFGAMLLLAGLGAGVLAARPSRSRQDRLAGSV